MPSDKGNSFAQILGRHAAGAGDSGRSGGSKPSKAQKTEKKPSDSRAGDSKSKRKKPAPAKKQKSSGKASGGDSRRGGKRSDPDYTHVTVLLHKDLIRRLKIAKVLQDRDMSDIVAEALEEALPPE